MLDLKYAPRGWNSWDCYGAAVTEDTVRRNADYMAANLKQYGYEYVVVDIQWYEPGSVNNEYHPFADVCMDEYGDARREQISVGSRRSRIQTACRLCSFPRP